MNTSRSLQLKTSDEQRHTEQAQTSLTLRSFTDYYLGTIFRPRRTFDALLADGRRLRFGLLALGINAVFYTLVYVFLSMGGGAPSSFTPWLAIPPEVYYYYNQFFLTPDMFMCWILAAGVAQLLSRPFLGSSFRGCAGVSCVPGRLCDLQPVRK